MLIWYAVIFSVYKNRNVVFPGAVEKRSFSICGEKGQIEKDIF